MRSVTWFTVVSMLLVFAAPAFASENGEGQLVAPSKAVADAWAREARQSASLKRPQKALNTLQITYAGLQAADMWTTIAARNNGAREVNPLMYGSYAKGMAFKAAMSASTMLATRAMAKKNKKAAVVTMILVNGVTAAVVANNVRNARR
jgi:glycine/D-amino acid oxidase-like deaminating enzyme